MREHVLTKDCWCKPRVVKVAVKCPKCHGCGKDVSQLNSVGEFPKCKKCQGKGSV